MHVASREIHVLLSCVTDYYKMCRKLKAEQNLLRNNDGSLWSISLVLGFLSQEPAIREHLPLPGDFAIPSETVGFFLTLPLLEYLCGMFGNLKFPVAEKSPHGTPTGCGLPPLL